MTGGPFFEKKGPGAISNMSTTCQSIDFRFPGLPHIGCAFTTRWAAEQGTGAQPPESPQTALAPGLAALQDRLGFQAWHGVRQVHGRRMLFCDEQTALPQENADALATSRSGLALLVRTADCQPILMTERSGSCIAAMHVGWRGNRAEVLLQWVRSFCARFRLSPQELLAVRGPSLSPARSEFVHFPEEWGPAFRPYFNPKDQTVDLWRLTRDQLLQAGLPRKNCFALDLCTYSLPELFFSYRRDRDRGRQAGLIWIEAEDTR